MLESLRAGEAAGRERFNWMPVIVGVAGTFLVLLVFLLGGKISSRPAGQLDNAYGAQVRAQATKVLSAQSMMAGSVIYVDGAVANQGPRTITLLRVRMRFHDLYGQLVQTENQDLVNATTGPLAPHASRTFRAGFDHISDMWNQAPPDLQLLQVYTK